MYVSVRLSGGVSVLMYIKRAVQCHIEMIGKGTNEGTGERAKRVRKKRAKRETIDNANNNSNNTGLPKRINYFYDCAFPYSFHMVCALHLPCAACRALKRFILAIHPNECHGAANIQHI